MTVRVSQPSESMDTEMTQRMRLPGPSLPTVWTISRSRSSRSFPVFASGANNSPCFFITAARLPDSSSGESSLEWIRIVGGVSSWPEPSGRTFEKRGRRPGRYGVSAPSSAFSPAIQR